MIALAIIAAWAGVGIIGAYLCSPVSWRGYAYGALIGPLALLGFILDAPEGYEDADGFHLGQPGNNPPHDHPHQGRFEKPGNVITHRQDQ